MGFSFVGGHRALDFVATMGRWSTTAVDMLVTPDDLSRWLVEAELVDEPVSVSEGHLDAARELRSAVYKLMLSTIARVSTRAEDRLLVNDTAAVPPVRLRLADDGVSLQRTGDVEAAMSTLARGVIELLASDDRNLIRQCSAEKCTRLYVDRSARGSRRWCEMRSCGNQAKAASFRRRHSG